MVQAATWFSEAVPARNPTLSEPTSAWSSSARAMILSASPRGHLAAIEGGAR